MKPKTTDFVSCDHLLWFFLSLITLTEVTINQWRDATLTCCLSVNNNSSGRSAILLLALENC